MNGCIRAGSGLSDGRQCDRRFLNRANCETRIELEIPDEKTGTPQKQVAYAPFLFVNKRSWGPLVRSFYRPRGLFLFISFVPRRYRTSSRCQSIENAVLKDPFQVCPFPCSAFSFSDCPSIYSLETPQFMHVTWNLAYSGSTPEKLLLADIVALAHAYNVTDTDFNKAKSQQLAEIGGQ